MEQNTCNVESDESLTPSQLRELAQRKEVEGQDAVKARIAKFGARARERRESLGLRSIDVAKKAGIPQPTVSTTEHGKNNPRLLNAALIAYALETTIEELLS